MKIVACEIFREEVEKIAPHLADQAEWLSPGLHVHLERLKEALEGALEGAQTPVCLFGACHPDLDSLLAECGGCRLPGKDCIAALLDEEARRELEDRKAFVMSPGWLRFWRDIFQEGQGWDAVDARQNFGFYESIALLDFGLEPIDELEILALFEYTQTPVEVIPASLDRFRGYVREVVGCPHPEPGKP